jgi:hypothetical protein
VLAVWGENILVKGRDDTWRLNNQWLKEIKRTNILRSLTLNLEDSIISDLTDIE